MGSEESGHELFARKCTLQNGGEHGFDLTPGEERKGEELEEGDLEEQLFCGGNAVEIGGVEEETGGGKAERSDEIDFGNESECLRDAGGEARRESVHCVGLIVGKNERNGIQSVFYELERNRSRLVYGVEKTIETGDEIVVGLRVTAHKRRDLRFQLLS